MGAYRSTQLEDFWNATLIEGLFRHKLITSYIGLRRWSQIDRRFRTAPQSKVFLSSDFHSKVLQKYLARPYEADPHRVGQK